MATQPRASRDEDEEPVRQRGPFAQAAEAPSARAAAPSSGSLFYARLVLGLWGVIGVGRHRRLLRLAAAAHRPARRAEAAAEHRHPGQRRLASRQSRRDGRAHHHAQGAAALPARRPSSPSRTGASTTISASTRSASPARSIRNLTLSGVPAGRLDPDAAARQEPLPHPGAHRLAQDPGGDPGALARAQLLQGRDPRTLPQPGLFRRRRLWRRGRRPALLRQVRPQRVAVGGGRARRASSSRRRASRPTAIPERAQARAELVIAAMNDLGFITPGMTKTALGAPAEPVRPKGAGSANYAADYVMDVLDDFVGTVESDIVVSTTIEPAMQAAAERVLVDELNAKGQKFNVSQGAFVAMQPDGAVQGPGRRPQLRDEPVQPGHRRAAPAGLVVQALRLSHRRRARLYARHGAARTARSTTRAGRRRTTTANIAGPSPCAMRSALSLNTVAVKLNLEVGAEGRGADGAAPRHLLAAAGQRLARARHLGGDAARTGQRLCGLRQWRHRRHPLRDRPGEDHRRQARLQAPECAAASAASSTRASSR